MSIFSKFSKAVHAQFMLMSKQELYEVDGSDIFEKYLSAFPEGTNPIFRERTEHDCSCCKNFIRNLGTLITIKDGKVSTVWDVSGLPHPYQTVADHLALYVGELAVKGIFRSKERRYGNESNIELINGKAHRWFHFWGDVSDRHFNDSPATARSYSNTTYEVFKRGLSELELDSIDTVLDLIDEKAIYRGEEFNRDVKEFRLLKYAYSQLNTDRARELFIWEHIHHNNARFRNTVIGTLITDLSTDVDIDKAVKAFESKVAPTNYKRPKALITKSMVENAMNKIRELDLETALERRFARISDVAVNDVLFVDNSVRDQMKDGIESLLMDSVIPSKSKAKPLDISINDFLKTIVPKAKSIGLELKNQHLNNFVSLTAPVHENSAPLFRWGSSFGWSYDGDLTDSIKEKVKAAGGRTDALLRFSLAWFNSDDLDIHAYTPDGHIYFYDKRAGHGSLDVDMNASSISENPVENIVFDKLIDGSYSIQVKQYNQRSKNNVGFVLQMEHKGLIKEYTFSEELNDIIDCITFSVIDGNIKSIYVNKSLDSDATKKEKWGVTTNTITPVDTILLSPNHWNGACEGNKHWFFILKNCHNGNKVRGIYNEFLRPDLNEHRKVFEVLGSKTKCEPCADQKQLSGVGFSSTKDDSVLAHVNLNGKECIYNVKFN